MERGFAVDMPAGVKDTYCITPVYARLSVVKVRVLFYFLIGDWTGPGVGPVGSKRRPNNISPHQH